MVHQHRARVAVDSAGLGALAFGFAALRFASPAEREEKRIGSAQRKGPQRTNSTGVNKTESAQKLSSKINPSWAAEKAQRA
jgi:hypothetical protein